MRKRAILLLSVVIFLTSCGGGIKNPVANDADYNTNISDARKEEAITDDQNTARETEVQDTVADSPSYMQTMAYEKAQEIGMLDGNEEEAIKLAYDYLIGEMFFADPIGLDVWRYFSDDPDTPYRL